MTLAADSLTLRHVTLDLPGPPARILPTDLNGDGRQDLLIVVAYSEVGQFSEDRIEDLIAITTVIPSVIDRREARLYLADDEGHYGPVAAILELPLSVLHMELGPPGLPVVALTDAGLSTLRFEDHSEEPRLYLEPLIEDPPFLARTGDFFSDLQLIHELNGDDRPDLLLPTLDGLAVYLADEEGFAKVAADRIDLNVVPHGDDVKTYLRYPTPQVRHINGDRYPDLVLPQIDGSMAPRHVWLGSAEGRFRPLRKTKLDCNDRLTDLRTAETGKGPWHRDLVALEDLDGDGRAEVVLAEMQNRGDGMRAGMKDTKRPIFNYRFHRLNKDMTMNPEPYFQKEIMGHTMIGDDSLSFAPSGMNLFEDLDGDGRKELVAITLDFSMFQVLKIMMTKRIGVGLNFHIYSQNTDGGFDEVPNLDLSEKLKINLNNFAIGRFAQFAGDFDGDGRQDFVHFGRGRKLTIHRGRDGAVYPRKADLTILLEEEPASLNLVRVEDLDGDERSDIRVTRPLPATDPDATAPVRLDLYLSGTGR